jgi:adenylylsulfate kinase-like enzyme
MVIVITGPIASGKSTIARELARELERTNVRVAVIDLDLIHDGLKTDGSRPDEASWALARHEAVTLANAFLHEGVAVVVAEGSFNTPDDRAALARHLHPGVAPLYVTLRVSFEEALRRAQSDPTRGKSRDPAFLEPYFETVNEALTTVPETDLVIDTEEMPPATAAAAIVHLVRQATSNRDTSIARPSLTRPRARSTLLRGHTRGAGGDDRAARP